MDYKTLRWYWGFFSETWKLFKKYRNVRGDAEWDRLNQEATVLRKKYPGEFSYQILMLVFEELDKNNQNNQKGDGSPER